jgi:hypothetical protein
MTPYHEVSQVKIQTGLKTEVVPNLKTSGVFFYYFCENNIRKNTKCLSYLIF